MTMLSQIIRVIAIVGAAIFGAALAYRVTADDVGVLTTFIYPTVGAGVFALTTMIFVDRVLPFLYRHRRNLEVMTYVISIIIGFGVGYLFRLWGNPWNVYVGLGLAAAAMSCFGGLWWIRRGRHET